MPELKTNKQYYAGVNGAGEVVGPVGSDREYVQQVMEAAFSRDNPDIRIETDEELELVVEEYGYKVKKVQLIVIPEE